MFYLINTIISIAINVVGGVVELPILGSIYSLAVLLPGIAVGVRRMHDINKSGWYLLIPIYNIVLLATNGDQGANEYGTDPKGNGEDILETFGTEEA
jgi:uncharacterized membrane protein YhaH (DUF805 family)